MSKRKELVISDARINGKLLECEFLNGQMKRTKEPQEFGYYLSAFLAAVSTFTDLVLIKQHGRRHTQVRKELTTGPSDLSVLLEARHVEGHRGGVRILLYRFHSSSTFGFYYSIANQPFRTRAGLFI